MKQRSLISIVSYAPEDDNPSRFIKILRPYLNFVWELLNTKPFRRPIYSRNKNPIKQNYPERCRNIRKRCSAEYNITSDAAQRDTREPVLGEFILAEPWMTYNVAGNACDRSAESSGRLQDARNFRTVPIPPIRRQTNFTHK